MASDSRTTSTVEELIVSGAIIAHKDGNYGSNYPRVEEFGTEGVPFLTAKSLRKGYVDIAGAPRLGDARADELTFGFVQPDDVLLSHNATIGRVAVVPQHKGRLLVGTSLTYFRLNPQKLLPRYFAVYLAGADFQNQLVAVMSHSTRNQVPVTAQRKLHVVVPPLAEQKAIASVLGALDDKIELNRRMNATLESMARALFQSWFVDFDPVRAKLDNRYPIGMDAATAALFPDKFEHQDGEFIPDGWRSITTEEVLSDDRGISVGVMYPGDHDPGGVPLIKAGDLTGGKINRNPEFRVSRLKHQEYRRTEFSGGEILMTLVGNIGQCAVVPPEMKGWNAARAVAVIRLADPTTAHYVRLWFESPPIQFLMHAWSNTTVQETLNLKEIRKLPLLWPPQSVLETFSTSVSPLLEQSDNNYRQSETLATLRDTLLPKLLSGELSVAGAECTMEAAV